MSPDPKIPNTILRRERKLRGWTLQNVADRLYKLCEKEGSESNISADSVGRWERGINIPQLHYQRKLCRLFGKSNTAELGFFGEDDETECSSVSQTPPSTILFRENTAATRQFDEHGQNSTYSPQGASVPSVMRDAGNPAGVSFDVLQGLPEVYIPLHQAFHLLHPQSDARPEQQVEAWQALLAGDLPPLFDLGWSVNEVLDAQRIILEGLAAMPERITNSDLTTGPARSLP